MGQLEMELVIFNPKTFLETLPEAIKRYSETYHAESNVGVAAMWTENNVKVLDAYQQYNADENAFDLSFSSNLFGLSVTVHLSIEDMVGILEALAKRVNKMKAALEAFS